MFKKFDNKENVTTVTNIKSSAVRNIRSKLLEQMPYIEQYLDFIMPKKEPIRAVKCHDHVELIATKDGSIIFFKGREEFWYPTLRLLHQYPFLLPKMQVDKGAIRFVLSGANIMCPGLTSPGGRMTQVPENTMVALIAEGKENIFAVGVTKLSSDKILSVNKGVGIENVHYLNDGLWHFPKVKG